MDLIQVPKQSISSKASSNIAILLLATCLQILHNVPTTESASLSKTKNAYTFSTQENNRLSYMLRPQVISARPTTPTRPPQVIFKLRGEYGVSRPQMYRYEYLPPKYIRGGELDFELPEDSPEVDEDYYPYQLYLDYEEGSLTPAKKSSAEELWQAQSIIIRPDIKLQKSLWNEYITRHISGAAIDKSKSQLLNEIEGVVHNNYDHDNYTIPSLRNYKFPEFRPYSTSTPQPSKLELLSKLKYISDEDVKNLADLDGDHSKYFVKTKPRDVSSSLANLYQSFYYEPPSYSTKIHPIPLKAKFPLSPTKLSPKFNSVDAEFVTSPMVTTIAPTHPPLLMTTKTTIKSYNSKGQNATISVIIQKSTKEEPKSENLDAVTGESILSAATIKKSPQSIHDNSIMTLSKFKSKNKVTFEKVSTLSSSEEDDEDETGIPGIPGIDYPTFDEIPQTNFNCQKQRYKGFFADIEAKCQAWHYCDFSDGQSSFLCPNGTLFSQVLLTCDWWFNVDCKQAQQLYVLNERLYRYIKPPKPSFPEDYQGPQVDLWLQKQLELGHLPKIKRKKLPIEKSSTEKSEE